MLETWYWTHSNGNIILDIPTRILLLLSSKSISQINFIAAFLSSTSNSTGIIIATLTRIANKNGIDAGSYANKPLISSRKIWGNNQDDVPSIHYTISYYTILSSHFGILPISYCRFMITIIQITYTYQYSHKRFYYYDYHYITTNTTIYHRWSWIYLTINRPSYSSSSFREAASSGSYL